MSTNSTFFGQIGGTYLRRSEVENGIVSKEKPFITFVVKEFYVDPTSLTEDEKKVLSYSVTNSNYINSMPINSIIGIDIEYEKGKEKILYPFFSQHLCLPLKPGEEVWAYKEGNLYYWLSRKAGSYQTEDPNFTYIQRQVNNESTVENRSSKSAFEEEETTINTLFPDGHNNESLNKSVGYANSFSDIVRTSTSYQARFQPEPIPRLIKNPGDLVIQGSNNTSITLGTSINKSDGKGTIDIVAGRTIGNKTVQNSLNYQEIDKQQSASKDAPINFSEDKSRIYVTMFDSSDDKFDVNIDGIDRSPSNSAVVLKSAQVRLIATEDIKITVGNTGAGIVIKADGNIVIVPSDTGVIKLGGEDANKAILCQDATEAIPGNVTAPPVISTAGGIIGSSAISGTGLFASKILVK
jgi:hypothetical protein